MLFVLLHAFFNSSPLSSSTVHSQVAGMCSPNSASNCDRVPSSCILKIGIQGCSTSVCTCLALAVCVPSSRCTITIFHCQHFCTNCTLILMCLSRLGSQISCQSTDSLQGRWATVFQSFPTCVLQQHGTRQSNFVPQVHSTEPCRL